LYNNEDAHVPVHYILLLCQTSLSAHLSFLFLLACDGVFILLCVRRQGTPVDLKGLSALAGTFKDNFPETLAKALVFPTSSLTPYLWSLCKVFLGHRTASKVVLLPGGKRPPKLKEFLPVHITPSLASAAAAKQNNRLTNATHFSLHFICFDPPRAS